MITFINKNLVKIVSIIKVNIESNYLFLKTMTSSLKRKPTSDEINADPSDDCIETNQYKSVIIQLLKLKSFTKRENDLNGKNLNYRRLKELKF
jgi:hypothetical protein